MKLNNNGWGLREMIIYSSILIIFLIIASVLIYRMYYALGQQLIADDDSYKVSSTSSTKKEEEKPTVTYNTLEEEIETSSLNYYNDFYPEGTSETIVININNLVNEGYLKQPTDTKDNKKCEGYALVKIIAGDTLVEPYLNCSNYQTDGYQSWRIGE